MSLPLSKPLAPALAVGLLFFSGCLSPGLGPRPDPFTMEFGEVTLTPEQTRVYRLPVTRAKDAEYNYTTLIFTEPGTGKEHSLYLHESEALRLEGLRPEQPVEIRVLVHWQSDGIKGGEHRWEREELDAVIGDGISLVDRSLCERHQARMTRQSVPIEYGLPSAEFLEAAQAFPHAAFELGGCCIGPDSPKTAYAYVCSACEAEHQTWSASKAPARP